MSCHIFSFFSFVTFWVEFNHIFSLSFCQILRFWVVVFRVVTFSVFLAVTFWVVTFWVFELCHILSFGDVTFWVVTLSFKVLSHKEFLSFVIFWVVKFKIFEFCHILNFLVKKFIGEKSCLVKKVLWWNKFFGHYYHYCHYYCMGR